jgi:3-phosphoshikimate 1-carboxyvinyltransferase
LRPETTLFLPYLQENSWQGDAQLVNLFKPLCVCTTFVNGGLELSSSAEPVVSQYTCDLASQPDLAQTLVVTCLMLGIPFRFSGLGNLKIKETDRIAALIAESKKMGFLLHEVAEGVLAWEGDRCPAAKPICIDTYEDHRMAMAFAPAVFKLGDICINNPQVVTKSYPQFWEELSKFVTFVS